MVGMHIVEEEKSNFWDTLHNNYVKMYLCAIILSF